jgi:hypothetical protein
MMGSPERRTQGGGARIHCKEEKKRSVFCLSTAERKCKGILFTNQNNFESRVLRAKENGSGVWKSGHPTYLYGYWQWFRFQIKRQLTQK